MDREEMTTKILEDFAVDISNRYPYSYGDVLTALSRGYRYFLDVGEDEETASDSALNMLARAVEAAPRYGFELVPMVKHMLLAELHRVPRYKSFIT